MFFKKHQQQSLKQVQVLVAQNDIMQARTYLEEFKHSIEKNKTPLGFHSYQLAHALILKSSSRMRDHVEAESILKKVIDKDLSVFMTNIALISLCYWYFEEFQISNQLEILEDIHPLIDHLQKNAKLENTSVH